MQREEVGISAHFLPFALLQDETIAWTQHESVYLKYIEKLPRHTGLDLLAEDRGAVLAEVPMFVRMLLQSQR